MAQRTDQGKVMSLLGPNYDRKTSLLPFIRQANVLTNTVVRLVAKYRVGMVLGADELLEIETLLAAHNYMMADPGYQQRATSSASGSFQTQKGNGLERTDYGKNALLVDWTGVLEALDKRKIASGAWVGTPYCEPTANIETD